jgi:hypothetical protein
VILRWSLTLGLGLLAACAADDPGYDPDGFIRRDAAGDVPVRQVVNDGGLLGQFVDGSQRDVALVSSDGANRDSAAGIDGPPIKRDAGPARDAAIASGPCSLLGQNCPLSSRGLPQSCYPATQNTTRCREYVDVPLYTQCTEHEECGKGMACPEGFCTLLCDPTSPTCAIGVACLPSWSAAGYCELPN